jgi:hypothetical protein
MRADTDYALCMQMVQRYGHRMGENILRLLNSGDTQMNVSLSTRTHTMFVHDISGTQIRCRNAQNGDKLDVQWRTPYISAEWTTAIEETK